MGWGQLKKGRVSVGGKEKRKESKWVKENSVVDVGLISSGFLFQFQNALIERVSYLTSNLNPQATLDPENIARSLQNRVSLGVSKSQVISCIR